VGAKNDKELIDVICEECGAIFKITIGSSKYRKRENLSNYCKNCISKHKSAKMKNSWKNKSEEDIIDRNNKIKLTWVNKSPIELEAHRQQGKLNMINMSNEKKIIRGKKISLSKKKYWDSIDKNSLVERSKKISNANKNYYMNETLKDKEIRINKKKDFWKNTPIEQKELISNKLSATQRNYWDNISDEEYRKICTIRKNNWKNKDVKQLEYERELHRKIWENKSINDKEKHSAISKINSRKYWDNLSIENYHEQCRLQSIEFNNIDHGIPIEETEIYFANDLNKYNIKYKYQYSNEIKHKNFDTLFPYNPVLKTDKIDPHHEWDFIIYNKQNTILVDIDGSIHDKIKTDYFIYKRNKRINLRDYIQFNDSQRPYQTITNIDDNIIDLNAYIVIAYDDNINDDTLVYEIKNDVYMRYEEFLNHIKYLNE
jgi:hypothetical protein